MVHHLLHIVTRGVGTCVRVGGQDQKWGAKDMNFKENPIFFSKFWLIFSKSGGAVAPPPCPPGSNTPVYILLIYRNFGPANDVGRVSNSLSVHSVNLFKLIKSNFILETEAKRI